MNIFMVKVVLMRVGNRQVGNTTLKISVDYSYATADPRKKARVRCVKN